MDCVFYCFDSDLAAALCHSGNKMRGDLLDFGRNIFSVPHKLDGVKFAFCRADTAADTLILYSSRITAPQPRQRSVSAFICSSVNVPRRSFMVFFAFAAEAFAGF